MTDDHGGFVAPPTWQKPTPVAVKAASKRLLRFALEHDVANDIAIVDMPIPGAEEELCRDQRLVYWFVQEQSSG